MTALTQLAKRFGVTRLARLTDLDRAGIEVVAAVRPRGHVLQVSQGKGLTLAAAQWSAVGEAVELAAAEAPSAERLVFGRAPPDALWVPGDEAIAWTRGELLGRGTSVWVPAEAVYCPPAGRAWLGPSMRPWRSNGLGMHPTRRHLAIEHAVLEVVERDALAQVLPDGWTVDAAAGRLVGGPEPLCGRLSAAGFTVFVFDLTPPRARLPVAGALLYDREEGPVPLTAGYACRRRFADAAVAAVLEAAQSRLTEIHGAREDVVTGQREAGGGLWRSLAGLWPRLPPRLEWTGPLAQAVRAPVALVSLLDAPWVVKAVSDELAVSELL